MEVAVIGILQPLVDAIDKLITFYHDAGLSWGLSIIVMTFTVRLLLVPLTYKQITGMLKMQEHQPEIKAINERYKEDPQRKQQEMMKFFKENKINPLSSCLPLLLQIPFFIATYYAIKDPQLEKEMAGASFAFIADLTSKATGAELVILMILYVGTQLAASLVSLSTATDDNQKRIMLILPLVFVVVIVNFPAGVILYWITSNTWTIGQAYAAKRIRQASQQHQHHEEAAATGAVAVVESKPAGNGKVAKGKAVEAVERKKAPPPPPRQKKKRSGRRR